MSTTNPRRDVTADSSAVPPEFDAPLKIESHGIDLIPESERHGRARQLFAVWAAPNVNFLGFIIGTVLVLSGLSLWQALAVAIAGSIFAVFPAIIAASGPAAGTPSEVITRAMFGVRGNKLNVAIAAWLISVCYLAINWAAAAVVAFDLLARAGIDVSTAIKVVTILVITAATLVISVYGHGFIMRFYQPIALILAAIFGVMAIFVVTRANWSYQPPAA